MKALIFTLLAATASAQITGNFTNTSKATAQTAPPFNSTVNVGVPKNSLYFDTNVQFTTAMVISIQAGKGRVTINPATGKVTLDGITSEADLLEAGKNFWEALAQAYPSVREAMLKVNPPPTAEIQNRLERLRCQMNIAGLKIGEDALGWAFDSLQDWVKAFGTEYPDKIDRVLKNEASVLKNRQQLETVRKLDEEHLKDLGGPADIKDDVNKASP